MPDPVEADAALSLPLGPELTIAQAAAQHDILLDALQRLESGVLRLDLSGVSDFDSSAIQLLLATRRSLQERAAELQLHQPSPVVVAALRSYGLDTTLQPLRASAAANSSEG
ncbi:STAS domain-containing protein [Paucibacter sp. AS339]|uniref:STAS domain-containing protein n=1 Tax=Paucibacter hankyongi TaxID=3133434 RepID=UPI0030B17F4E